MQSFRASTFSDCISLTTGVTKINEINPDENWCKSRESAEFGLLQPLKNGDKNRFDSVVRSRKDFRKSPFFWYTNGRNIPSILPRCPARFAFMARIPTTMVAVCALVAWLSGMSFGLDTSSPTESVGLEVFPPQLRLVGRGNHFGLIVSGSTSEGRSRDLTHRAIYRSTNPELFTVDKAGNVRGVADGDGSLEVSFEGLSRTIPVTVTGTGAVREIDFQNDVIPVMTRFGCNSSGCHGKAEGQNGFKLSVFGFDALSDYEALLHEGRGRRISLARPEQSLLLKKAIGEVPHGGGARMEKSSRAYQVIRDWIATGASIESKSARIDRIELYPEQSLLDYETQQQLRVVAVFQDGSRRDVTELAKFQSNNEAMAKVDETGRVTIGTVPGHAAVMASFLDKMDTFQVLIPQPVDLTPVVRAPAKNRIDELINARLDQLNIAASDMSDDATFMRRIYIDTIGTMPTRDEVREFLGDTSQDKYQRLVDHLLERPEYADYWALKWSDTLRVEREALGHKAAYEYYRWIRDSLADNMPFDEFTRSIVSARGGLRTHPAGNFYKAVTDPGKRASSVAQVFLGVRIECAQCHHHPFDRWSQTDYHGMLAYFKPATLKVTSRDETLLDVGEFATEHPRTKEKVVARPLLGPEVNSDTPARDQLALWLTSPENPWFGKNIANRVWAHYMGRGLIEPVDDIRTTNPPTNPELMDELTRSFVDSGYDVKSLIRSIVATDAYRRSTHPNESNRRDEQNYSRALFKRIDAEVLLDAICQSTGVPEKFRGVPLGSRAIQLWDSGSPHYFLNLFGRPLRKTACECERSVEPNVGQVLHILNSPEIHSKLTHDAGQIAKLVEGHSDDAQLVEELYLTVFNRYPTEDESQRAVNVFAGRPHARRSTAEDLTWSMFNSHEFLFNH